MPWRVTLSDSQVEEAIRLLTMFGNECEHRGDLNTMGASRRLARDIRDLRDRIREEKAKVAGAHPVTPPDPAPQPQEPLPTPAPAPVVIETASPPSASSVPLQPEVRTIPEATIEWPKGLDGVTRLLVPAGIGDIAWVYQIVHGLSRRWGSSVELVVAGEHPRRAKEFIDLLPGVQCGGYGDFTSPELTEALLQRPAPTNVDDLKGRTLPFSVNHHLEMGGRIDTVYPEVEKTFALRLKTSQEQKERAKAILGQPATPPIVRGRRAAKPAAKGPPIIGLYPASYRPAQAIGFWDETGWLTLARGLRAQTDCSFVVIGAAFDEELQGRLCAQMETEKMPVQRCTGEHFGVAVEVLRGLDLLLAFPSGIPVVATLIGTPTVWWLPDKEVKHGGNWKNLTGWAPSTAAADGLLETRAVEAPDVALAGVLASKGWARVSAR